ncbi:hypothetical protein [Streptomyces sp. NPDC058745]|uniref:hypothetical protein n=1 Tax=Streptomyces sp. NPDC058745 TaxID=3346621 RepID=UPI00368829C5
MDTLLRSLGLIQPGGLIHYHGSQTVMDGLYLAAPCSCREYHIHDQYGINDLRYQLTDPYAADPSKGVLVNVRRESITRSTANA